MDRPADLFDREREWKELSALCSPPSGASLGIVYGRRRLGKSFLLRRLVAGMGGLYHQALEEQRAQALARLGETIATERGIDGGQLLLHDWSEALGTALAAPPGQRSGAPRVVVLDELPYWLAHSPELPSLLQGILDRWNEGEGTRRATLILCGSALSVMSELISGARALRGRARLELVFAPFDFRSMREYWGIRQPGVALVLHSIVGGTAGYRDLMGRPPRSLKELPDWLGASVLNPAHALFREAEYILAEDPRLVDRGLYHSLLDAISRGEQVPTRIAGRIGRQEGALRHPLRLLQEAGFVRREEDAFLERRPLYSVADPIVRFHHVIMRPAIAQLEERRAKEVWRQREASFRSQILGPHFESLAREWTLRFAAPDTLGGEVGEVSPATVADPANRTTVQIDVVALAAEPGRGGQPRVLMLGEAKHTQDRCDIGDLQRLERSRSLIETSGRASGAASARLALFSSAGFTGDLTAAARRRHDVILVDLERLYEGS